MEGPPMTDEDASTRPDGLVGETLDEHRSCMRVVRDLEGYLATPADREGRWVEGLAVRLGRLCGTLEAHFAAEQNGPLFRQLPLSKPRLADRLKRLEREHDEILEAGKSTQGRAEGLREGAEPYELHELNARVQLLIARIQRHESEENEVVLEAHWNDLGLGD
jgi:hypothetical protein